MKLKLLILSLLATSLIGYLEWGQEQHVFLFQAEKELLSKIVEDPLAVLHPFTVLPMLGQLLLLIALFQKRPKKFLVLLGIVFISLLLLLVFAIGLMNLNIKMLVFSLPFLIIAIVTIREFRKKN